MVHVCNEAVNALINGNEFNIDEEVDKDILNVVVGFVDFAEGQKHTFLNVSKLVLVVCHHPLFFLLLLSPTFRHLYDIYKDFFLLTLTLLHFTIPNL